MVVGAVSWSIPAFALMIYALPLYCGNNEKENSIYLASDMVPRKIHISSDKCSDVTKFSNLNSIIILKLYQPLNVRFYLATHFLVARARDVRDQDQLKTATRGRSHRQSYDI